jgi:hypothetical protein
VVAADAALAFTRRLQILAQEHADDVLLEIQSDLLENPERGRIVQGTAGVWKSRAADPVRGKGKRGGYRYTRCNTVDLRFASKSCCTPPAQCLWLELL